MFIDKFRLDWRSNPQQQYNELQKMVMHLTNIANSMTDINIKLNVLAQIATVIGNQSLLLQAIADNTACACNGISQVNDNLSTINTNIGNKLDYIAELIQSGATPPAGDTYLFELFITSVEITQDIIDAGSFILSGVTRKNGAIFDELSLVDHYDFIDSVSVLAPGQIEVQLVPGAEIPDGTLVIQIQQAESEIVQQFSLYYQAPAPVYVNYVELLDGTILPIFSSQDVSSISTTSDSPITLSGYTFTKLQVKKVSLVEASVINGVIPNYFCYGFSKLTELVLPDSGITSVGFYFLGRCLSFNQPVAYPSGLTVLSAEFLSGCESFNSPLTIPSSVVDIRSNFLVGAVSFNQPLILPPNLTAINDGFMQACYAFNHPISLPSTLGVVNTKFMYSCTSFTGPLDIGSLAATVFRNSNDTLSMPTADVPAYTVGISVVGDNLSEFFSRFPNRVSPYRKLLRGGLSLTPGELDFTPAGETKSVQFTSSMPWHYVGYKDNQGNFHAGVLPDWLHAGNISSGDRGNFTFDFTADENTSGDSRYALLSFDADDDPKGDLTVLLTVRQDVAAIPLSVSVQGDFITTGMSSQDAVIQIDSQKILDVDTDSSYHFNMSGVGASVIPPSFELSGTILVNGARKQANLTFLIDIEGYSLVGSVLKSVPAKGEGSMSANQFNLQTADNGPLEVRFSIAGEISGNQITWVACSLD